MTPPAARRNVDLPACVTRRNVVRWAVALLELPRIVAGAALDAIDAIDRRGPCAFANDTAEEDE